MQRTRWTTDRMKRVSKRLAAPSPHIFILWILGIVAAQAVPIKLGNDPKLFTPTNEVVTPHIPWLKPAQERLKILFIARHYGMREAIELSQRLDADCAVFAMGPDNCEFYFNTPFVTRKDRQADLEQKLQAPCDIIVMNHIAWKKLPLHSRYLILKRVKEGTALFGKIVDPDEYLTRAVREKIQPDCSFLTPFRGLPAFCSNVNFRALIASTVDAAQFGKGRIVLLKDTGYPQSASMIPPSPDNPLDMHPAEYDYYWAYLIHLIQYAAGRTLQPTIAGRDSIRATNNAPPAVAFTVAGRMPHRGKAWFTVRDLDGRVLVDRQEPLARTAGTNTLILDTGPLPAGRYFADLRITEKGKILNFGSSFLEVTSDPGIEKIEVKSDVRQEEPVEGRVLIAGAPTQSSCTVAVAWRDNYGRLIARRSCPVAGQKEVPFQFPSSTPLSILQYIEAELRGGSKVLDRKRVHFSISNLYPKDDFRIIAWGNAWGGYLSRYVGDALRRGQFDTTYTQFSEALPLANLWHIPYAIRLADQHTPKGTTAATREDHIRVPCLTDPEYLKKEREKLVQVAEKVRPYSTLEFSLGDECVFANRGRELCFSPTCVAAFHAFLAKEYPTVGAMNAEYETAYKSFDEVQPVTFDYVKTNATLIPLWVDYRRHMESVWADIHGQAQDWIRTVVPDAKIGHEGTEPNQYFTSLQAYDFDKIMQAVLLNCTYEGQFVPYAIGDLRRPGTLFSSGWFGSYIHLRAESYGIGYRDWRAEIFPRYCMWRHLLRGANSLWVFDACLNGGTGSVLAPDLTYYEYFKPAMAEFKELKAGIGKLFMTAKRDSGGVAILYSASSVHVSTFTQREGLPAIATVLDNIVPLFEDALCPFRIVSCRQVAEGILDTGEFRILWMPLCQALSDREARAIKRFAEAGGTVIADLRPGVCDEHGKPYAKGALDDLFGITRSTNTVTVAIDAVSLNEVGFPKSYPRTGGDAAVRTTTGQAKGVIGKSPALVVNPCGKGKGILLNFSLANYCDEWINVVNPFGTIRLFTNNVPAVRVFLQALLASAGYDRMVQLHPDVPGLRAYRFTKGPLEYIGLLRELPGDKETYYTYGPDRAPLPPVPVTLSLGRQGHVYDLRQGRYLGFKEAVDTTVKPGEARVFGVLPYRVDGLRVRLPSKIGQGETLTYQVRPEVDGAPDIGLHVYHVRFTDPEGQDAEYYACNLAAERGVGNAAVSLALDEKPGQWKLRVKDVATGVTAARTFTVQGGREP